MQPCKTYLNRESVNAGWSCKYLKTFYNGDFSILYNLVD